MSAFSSADEPAFKKDYAVYAKQRGLNLDPDDPLHRYDYRAAWAHGGRSFKPDSSGHLPSQFKREGHPRMVVDGRNTKTGKLSAQALNDLGLDWGPAASLLNEEEKATVFRAIREGLDLGLNPDKDLWSYVLGHHRIADPGRDAPRWRRDRAIRMHGFASSLARQAVDNVVARKVKEKEAKDRRAKEEAEAERVGREVASLVDRVPEMYGGLFPSGARPEEAEVSKLQNRAIRKARSLATNATRVGEAERGMEDWLRNEYLKKHGEAAPTRQAQETAQRMVDVEQFEEWAGSYGFPEEVIEKNRPYLEDAARRILTGTSDFGKETDAFLERVMPKRGGRDETEASHTSLVNVVNRFLSDYQSEVGSREHLAKKDEEKEMIAAKKAAFLKSAPVSRAHILAALRAHRGGNLLFEDDVRRLLIEVWNAKGYGALTEEEARAR